MKVFIITILAIAAVGLGTYYAILTKKPAAPLQNIQSANDALSTSPSAPSLSRKGPYSCAPGVLGQDRGMYVDPGRYILVEGMIVSGPEGVNVLQDIANNKTYYWGEGTPFVQPGTMVGTIGSTWLTTMESTHRCTDGADASKFQIPNLKFKQM